MSHPCYPWKGGGSAAIVPSDRSLVVLRKRPAEGGRGNFLVLGARARPSRSPSPVAPPRSREDVLASRLVQCISSGAGSDRDLRLRVTWIHLAVSRLCSSSALYEAINLLLGSWTSFNLAPTANPEIDRAAYIKALNTLNAALSDPVKSYSVDTLAATALVHRVEFDYDMKARRANESNHASGLSALMVKKGPPRADDELDVRLCFENLHSLLPHILLGNKDNFFSRPEWLRVMRDAAQKNATVEDPLWIEYDLSIHMTRWPDLVKDLRALNDNPNPFQAENLIIKSKEAAQELCEFDIVRITQLQRQGHIWTIIEPGTASLPTYEFDDCTHCQIFHQHALVSIAVNRILQKALGSIGDEDLSVESRIREYSERIWKTLPYVERMSRTVRDNFLAPLVLSLESADGGMRRYLAQKIIEISGPRAQFLGDCPEADCLAVGRALTGRVSPL
ncbi:hypothetical protein F4781DRAFT_442227 [Annulohypoxylon bovei var. microspora]|nr:hypothetical protein F4781DRAFT_442227 [Annulohypoxylon bovei var. microspora]